MYRTIVVPLDGSEFAARALPYAEQLARSSTGRVVLVRAMALRGVTVSEQLEREMETQPAIEEELKHVANDVSGRGVPGEIAVYYGEAAQAIESAAERCQADLIVMSTHGRGGLARLAYGSVAERVLRKGTRPVMLVPIHCMDIWNGVRGPIVVPLDGSAVAEEAIGPAIELARSLGTSLLFLQVIEPPSSAMYMSTPGAVFPVVDLDAWAEEVKPYMNEVASRVTKEGVKAVAETFIGYAAASIATVAADHKACAIVMTTHGRTGLARLVIGSVTNGVTQRADMPVLVVRPQAVQAETEPVQPAAAQA